MSVFWEGKAWVAAKFTAFTAFFRNSGESVLIAAARLEGKLIVFRFVFLPLLPVVLKAFFPAVVFVFEWCASVGRTSEIDQQ